MSLARPLLSLSLLIVSPSAFGADPPSPTELVEVRAQTNARLAQVRHRLAEVTVATSDASASFKQCKNGRLQLQFGTTLASVERGRVALETVRRAAERRRRALEASRSELEAAHLASVRHASSAQERVEAEHTYAAHLAEAYLTPFQSEVVAPLEAYVAGMNDYAFIVQRYAAFCAAPDYTPTAGAALVGELAPKTDALVANAEKLVPPGAAQLARHVKTAHGKGKIKRP